jgi:hypothetical protein
VPVTFPIPAVTLPAGTRTFGPAAVPDADTRLTLTVDRTPAGGLTELTAASALDMEAQMSSDGGTTWHAVDTGQPGTRTSWTTIGGPVTSTDRQGTEHTAAVSSGTWPLFPGASRLVRATVTVSGPAPIAVTGSIATA